MNAGEEKEFFTQTAAGIKIFWGFVSGGGLSVLRGAGR
jgi:hypothetical protein